MIQSNNIEFYEVLPTDEFNDNMKYYIKKKKFKKISEDIDEVLSEIQHGNFVGDKLEGLKLDDGNVFVYKARAGNSDTNSGKSNGYRIIYYVKTEDKIIFLLTIYYKKEDKNIPSDQDIVNLINTYCI